MNVIEASSNLDRLHRLHHGLVKARAMVERGWCQNKSQNAGRVCLEAALAMAARGGVGFIIEHTPDSKQLVAMCYQELKARHDPWVVLGKCSVLHVWPWNDRPERTKADVLELMDAVLMNIDAQIEEHRRQVTITMRPGVPDLFWDHLAKKQAKQLVAA